jgi:hypothetical protein
MTVTATTEPAAAPSAPTVEVLTQRQAVRWVRVRFPEARVTAETIRLHWRQRLLPGWRYDGKVWFRKSDLETWYQAQLQLRAGRRNPQDWRGRLPRVTAAEGVTP